MKNVLIILSIALLTSCASTTQFVKYTGKDTPQATTDARIYILRPSFLGSAIKMKVFCNDTLVGKTGPLGYLSWDVKEGAYTIKSTSENTDYFTVNAKAGKTYYIKQRSQWGWLFARVSLKGLDEVEGQEILSKLKKPTLKYIE